MRCRAIRRRSSGGWRWGGGSRGGRREPGRGPMASDPIIEFIDVHKWYGAFHVLREINLTVGRGERIVVCGPSGSGKSTLIRCVNRLEEHQRGVIRVDGIELTARLAQRRRSAARSRHGVPVVQPLPPSDGAGELHAGADLGAQDAEARGGRAGDEVPRRGSRSPSRRSNIPASFPAASSSASPSPALCA